MKRKQVEKSIDPDFVIFYFPKFTYNGKSDDFPGTPPDCYDFSERRLQPPLKLREIQPDLLPIVPSKNTYDSFNHVENILFWQRKLERSAVLGMLRVHIIGSCDDVNHSKLLFKAWSSISRPTAREYLENDARGVKRNFITSFIRLRKHPIFEYNEIFNQFLTDRVRKGNVYGLRYVPVGYVTTDMNILRQYIWSFNSMELKNGYMIQKYDHRKVAIFYDLKTKSFVVKVYPELCTTKFFDDYTDNSIIDKIGKNSPDYKKMEIKVKENEIDKYRPENTRVFNVEKFTREHTFIFSLEKFSERNNKKVSVTISDNDMDKNSVTPHACSVNYTMLIYSIIQTWLHSYSEYFGKEFEITVTKPYFQCYYDKLMGMYTNTYIMNYTD